MARDEMRSDELLVDEALNGAPMMNPGPFQELVRRHHEAILADCRHIVGSVEDAEDLAQEVFVRAYFALGAFQKRSRFRTWLQRIKINHCLSHLRKVKGRVFVDLDDPALRGEEELRSEAKPAGTVPPGERDERIHRVLGSMPDTLRLPLVLCDADELSCQEAADSLGIGLSALKMRLKRGREVFRRRYGEQAASIPARASGGE